MTRRRWLTIMASTLLMAGLCACETRESQSAVESSAEESASSAESEVSDVASDTPSESEQDGQEVEEVEFIAGELLEALKSGDRTRIGAYVDYNDLLQIQDGDPDENLLAILKRMEYEVIGGVVDGDTASVKVSITNIDMHAVLPTYLKQAMDMEYNNAISEAPMNEEQMEQEYIKLFDGSLNYNAINTVERAVDIELVRVNGSWVVQSDELLRSAAFGDFWSARTKVGENAR